MNPRMMMSQHLRRAMSCLLFLAALVVCAPSRAELQIDITKGVTDPIPVAIVPFARSVPTDAGVDVAALVQRDLEGSGRFRGMERRDMLSSPSRSQEVQLSDWRTARNDYILVGRVFPASANEVVVEYELVNLLNGQKVLDQRVSVAPSSLRYGAHLVADAVFEKITGTRGAFATRIAYVLVDGAPPAQRYQLTIADADGENQRVVLESSQPIMSPSWSPDGQWLAYVSFESRNSAVFVQRVRTGERRQVSARPGINGAPSFSPDGSKLALTLSGSSGNVDVFVLDLGNQGLTRLTEDPAIDTEPTWSPDGRSIYFTSDRAGGPQVYRVAAQGGEAPRRVSFGVPYASRPRLSPDGQQLAMAVRDGGAYRIAVQDLSGGPLRVLSRGNLDESPSFAPNGAQLIYAGRERGQGVLQIVSVDGQVTQRLRVDRGNVREPVWGPFSQPVR